MQAEASQILIIFQKYKEKPCGLRDTEAKTDAENPSISNYFCARVNNKSKYNERTMFPVSLQNFGLYLNP